MRSVGAWTVACLMALGGTLTAAAGGRETLRIDPATSRVQIHVGKAGAFGFAGHPHQVQAPATGSVTLDSSDIDRSEVIVEFDSASLRVTGEGEPAGDVPEVQRVMLSERVLDVRRFPKVVFRSRRVSRAGGGGGQALSLMIEGDLTLHGVTKPVAVPLRLTLGEGTLTAEGRTTVTQTSFGIQPVTAAGGTVRVKDAVDIEFVIRATR